MIPSSASQVPASAQRRLATKSGKAPSPSEMQAVLQSFQQGLLAEAEQQARELSRRHPKHGFGWKVLGALLQMRNSPEALSVLQRAAEMLPEDAEAQYNYGNSLLDDAQYKLAAQHFRRALRLHPGFVQAQANLARTYEAMGRLEDALEVLQQAVQCMPQQARICFSLGELLSRLARHAEALPHLQEAIRLQPDMVAAHRCLSEVYQQLGQVEASEQALRQVVLLTPEDAAAHFNLGNRLHQRRALPEAVQAYTQAIALTPDFDGAHNNLGTVLRELGQRESALESYQQALLLNPQNAGAWNNIAIVQRELHQFAEAEEACQQALALQPDLYQAFNTLGIVYREQGKLDEARQALLQAIAIRPDYVDALSNLGGVYRDEGKLAEAEASFRAALAIDPDYALAWSNLLFCLTHMASITPQALFAEHQAFAERFEQPLRAHWPQHTNGKDPARPLRIGFVSADLRAHPVANFIDPVLAHLAQSEQVSLYAYANHATYDATSARLRGYFKVWHQVLGLSDAALAECILQDGIDVLIDLSGHTAGHRLHAFARKPAPVQLSWIGYPGTTGLQAMDYYLGDHFLLPEGLLDAQFTEKLVQLPASAPFMPESMAPEVNALPAQTNGYVTFGSFNRPSKLSQPVIACWAEVLKGVPQAKMLLAAMPQDGSHQVITQWFADAGIAEDRLIIVPRSDMGHYLRLHHTVDICLDTFPYNGGTTTWHALWMGVPTVTLAGNTLPCRIGAGILGHVGLQEFVVESSEAYVACAVHWAEQLTRLAEIRASLRQRFADSAPGHPEQIAQGLLTAVRLMWQRWCDGLPTQAIPLSSLNSATAKEGHLLLDANTGTIADAQADADVKQTYGWGWRLRANLPLPQVPAWPENAAAPMDAPLQQAVAEVMQMAVQLQSEGLLQESLQACFEVLKIAPQHAPAVHRIGLLEAHILGLEKALPRLRQAVCLAPQTPQFWLSLIDAMQQCGDTEGAGQALLLALTYGFDPEDAQMLASEFGIDLPQRAEAEQAAFVAMQHAVADSLKAPVVLPHWQPALPADALAQAKPVFYIQAPDYSDCSSGIRAMHLLCDRLRREGYEAWVTTDKVHPALDTPHLDEALRQRHLQQGAMQIAVYPELEMGNPLQTPFVVRYLLNRPNHFIANSWFGQFNAAEYILHYDETYRVPWVDSHALRIQTVDRDIFHLPRQPQARSGFLVYSHRVAPDLEAIPAWCQPYQILSMAYPKSPQELAQLYQQAQGMIVYHKTAAAVEAMLCGCPVLYCTSRGLQRETVFYPGFEDFAKVWDFDQAAFFAAQDSIAGFSDVYDAQELPDRRQLQETVADMLQFFRAQAVPAIAHQPQVLLAQAKQYEQSADYVQATQYYRRSLQLAPERLETRFYFGRMLAEIGLNQAASKVLAPGQNEWQKLPKDAALETVRAGYSRLMSHVMASPDDSRQSTPPFSTPTFARTVE